MPLVQKEKSYAHGYEFYSSLLCIERRAMRTDRYDFPNWSCCLQLQSRATKYIRFRRAICDDVRDLVTVLQLGLDRFEITAHSLYDAGLRLMEAFRDGSQGVTGTDSLEHSRAELVALDWARAASD
jgi:hypothetical protein